MDGICCYKNETNNLRILSVNYIPPPPLLPFLGTFLYLKNKRKNKIKLQLKTIHTHIMSIDSKQTKNSDSNSDEKSKVLYVSNLDSQTTIEDLQACLFPWFNIQQRQIKLIFDSQGYFKRSNKYITVSFFFFVFCFLVFRFFLCV